nr:hypothetical protein [Gemmatimonadaceae bacterium]
MTDPRAGRGTRARESGPPTTGTAIRPAADLDDPALAALPPRTLASLLAAAGDVAVVVDTAGMVQFVLVTGADQGLEAAESWMGRPFADTVTSETRP